MKKFISHLSPLLTFLTLTSFVFSTGCAGPIYKARNNELKTDHADMVTVMDFSKPISINPIEPGWYHYTFFWHKPMGVDFVTKENVPAIRLNSNNSASIIIRHVDIDLDEYPFLSWNWFIEQPITSTKNEKFWWGDDHPARLVIFFQTDSGKKRSMEIIWGNRLKGGDYKYTSLSHHYVARGGTDDLNRWIHEEVNLLQIYHNIWPGPKPAKVMAIGIFTDSDNTNGKTTCYFGTVSMKKQKPAKQL
ncbi:MAG: DUF3047 domain-containing protein [Thermodesulfobacteriota bacterium]